MIERIMQAIEATAPNASEGLVFTYGQVERGIRAALASRQTIDPLRRKA